MKQRSSPTILLPFGARESLSTDFAPSLSARITLRSVNAITNRPTLPIRAVGKRQSRATRAKLWIVNLNESSIPESELTRYEDGELKAKRLVKNAVSSKTGGFHWPYKPKMASELETGDWLIQTIKSKDGSVLVHPPGQLLLIDSYVRDPKSGKERYVFHLELPRHGETLTWDEFHTSAKALSSQTKLLRRTMPVRNPDDADELLRLWTPTGRVSRR